MSAEVISGLIVAAVAVLGSIGSVLLLAYHVGQLTGKMDARIKHVETDNINIWKAFGNQVERLNRHIEAHTKGKR